MEYGLRRFDRNWKMFCYLCLNPCFNGIWSATQYRRIGFSLNGKEVLILVLMEYGLRHNQKATKKMNDKSLNPCFNGIWSATVRDLSL